MSEICFEDEVIKIEEDIETIDVAYDIRDNNLIATKTLKQSLSSKIYNYDDGISVYLKFEDNGNFMNLMFAIYQANSEKQILSLPRHASLYLRRIDKRHFHILAKDEINKEANLVAITIKDEMEIVTVQFNFTEIIEYKLLDDKYLLINAYEDMGNGSYLYTMGVYNLAGKAIQIFLDKKVNQDNSYEFAIQQLPNGRRKLLALHTHNAKTKIIGKILLQEGFSKEVTNMLESNKQLIKDSMTKKDSTPELVDNDNMPDEVENNLSEDTEPVENMDSETLLETQEPSKPPAEETSSEILESSGIETEPLDGNNENVETITSEDIVNEIQEKDLSKTSKPAKSKSKGKEKK
ncbi:MAG: hypothetical protein ACI4PF_00645 [Christensenellales bacterium]